MNPPIAALEFIGRSISPNESTETVKPLHLLLRSKQLSWEEVAFLANINLVTPLLWLGLHQKGLINKLPEDFQRYLAEIHRQNTLRNTHLERQLLEIARALNQHGIVPVALKGAACLLTETFPNSGARIMTDLDLLVPKEHLPISVELLHSLGYSTDEALRKKYRHHHHYAPLFRPGEFASVELHHTLLYQTAAKMLPTNTAWKQAEPLAIKGASLQVLSPTHRILHNILHSEVVDRNYEKGLIPLRELGDLVYTQHRYPQKIDWSVIETTLTRHGRRKFLYSYLYLAHRYLEMPLPIPLRPTLGNFIHHQRCRSRIRWAWFIEFDRHMQGFSTRRICRLYGCPPTFPALAWGRLRYAARITEKYLRSAAKAMGKSLGIRPLQGNREK